MSGDFGHFLADRYDEAEALARGVDDHSEPWPGQWEADGNRAVRTYNGHVLAYAQGGEFKPGFAAYVADNDPARRLADIKLKRAILAEHVRVPVYKPETLALYPDHPEMADAAVCRRCHELDPDALVDDDRCGDLAWPCATVRQLGTEFAEHPAYKEGWKP